jgi:hypothetical protein
MLYASAFAEATADKRFSMLDAGEIGYIGQNVCWENLKNPFKNS